MTAGLDAEPLEAARLLGAAQPLATPRAWRGPGFGIVWFAIGFLAGCKRLGDNSFLTHLATGRIIRESGVPTVDPYSFTRPGTPWVVQSWLASWWNDVLVSLSGLGLLRWFVGLTVGTMAWLTWRLTARADGLLSRCIVMAAAGVVGVSWWGERPQMLAFVFLAVALLVVVEYRSALWLVPLFAVWVNIHGSWPVAAVLLGLVVIGSGAVTGEEVATSRARQLAERSVGVLVAAGVGVLAGAFIGPLGWSAIRFPIDMARRSEQLAYVLEWRSPSISDPEVWVILAMAGVVGHGVVRAGARNLQAWRWAPLTLVALGSSLVASRNLAVAAIALVPAVADSIPRLGTIEVPVTAGTPGAVRRVTALCAVVVAVVCAGLVAATPPHIDLTPYPTAVVDALDEQRLVAREGVRLAAVDWVGNYLTWRYGAEARVFMDDRAEVYDLSLYRDHGALLWDGEDWREILDRRDINVVVWEDSETLTKRLAADDDWRIVSTGGGFTAFCRIGSLAC